MCIRDSFHGAHHIYFFSYILSDAVLPRYIKISNRTKLMRGGESVANRPFSFHIFKFKTSTLPNIVRFQEKSALFVIHTDIYYASRHFRRADKLLYDFFPSTPVAHWTGVRSENVL